MKIAILNRHWDTAGGGETYGLGIAHALAGAHEVTLLSAPGVDWPRLGERLRLPTDAFEIRDIDLLDPARIGEIAEDYGAFVNVSHATDLPNPGGRGLLVVHFPRRFDHGLGRLQRGAMHAAMRAGWFPTPRLQFDRGVFPDDTDGPPFRWTSAHAEMTVDVGPGQTSDVLFVFGHDRPIPADVEIRSGGHVQRITVTPDRAHHFASVPVIGNAAGRAHITLDTDTFRPCDVHGTDDFRELGVPLVAWRVGSGVMSKLRHRVPALRHLEKAQFTRTYDHIVANSSFTAAWIKQWWGASATVAPPAIVGRPAGTKRPIILSVGRFFGSDRGHSKKQLEMVQAFQRLHRTAKGWELHLVGGCQPEDVQYLESVRAAAAGLPVEFHVDSTGDEIDALYASASIYWHATGLGESPRDHPERHEHFGIAPLEAMSGGAVPVVVGAAGPGETVRDGIDGFHFDTLDALVVRTRTLMSDDSLRSRMSAMAVERAGHYSLATLRRSLEPLLEP